MARRGRSKRLTQIKRGLIDRQLPLVFEFDGEFTGYQGYIDCLLATVFSYGSIVQISPSTRTVYLWPEEANAIVQLRDARKEPNTRATTIELYDGLTAKSQNRWPSLAFDIMATNDLFKIFFQLDLLQDIHGQRHSGKVYEPIIRRIAGLGSPV